VASNGNEKGLQLFSDTTYHAFIVDDEILDRTTAEKEVLKSIRYLHRLLYVLENPETEVGDDPLLRATQSLGNR
jgi:hypothetical protein